MTSSASSSLLLLVLLSLTLTLSLCAIPQPGADGVIELTSADYDDTIKDPTHDVMLEIYDPSCNHCQALMPIWSDLGDTFKEEDSVRIARMTIVDASHRKKFRDEGLTVYGVPTIIFFKGSDKTPLYFQGRRTLNAFIEFIEEHADHTIEIPINYASLPEPDNTGRAVTEVVGSTFRKYVKDPNKDVFVNFFAPWCPYSQRLAGTWNELGERLKNDANSNILIAKMDGTANEVPGLHIHAFPTVTLYAAGDNEMYAFKGPRTVDALLEFLQIHSVNRFLDPVENKWSHEVPKNYKDHAVDVEEITDDNFNAVVGDTSKNIAVLYYADWDPHSQELFPAWSRLAAEYASVDVVRVVQMDATKHESDNIEIYPTIMLYPEGRPVADEGVRFKGKEKTLKALKEFINSQSEKSDNDEIVIEHAEKTADAVKEGKPMPKLTAEVISAKREFAALNNKQAAVGQSLNYNLAPDEEKSDL
eukprot:TRINITY_DN10944_c0_g1_i1.p1 TRINITY_DN10944_c0_g1~~TRINITY_DN10944_c0_g1_i1.p1  ORF type:complete len:474 (+),score=117.68 TRINITY_DN10944_c0_g1_i1:16-1437(+)